MDEAGKSGPRTIEFVDVEARNMRTWEQWPVRMREEGEGFWRQDEVKPFM